MTDGRTDGRTDVPLHARPPARTPARRTGPPATVRAEKVMGAWGPMAPIIAWRSRASASCPSAVFGSQVRGVSPLPSLPKNVLRCPHGREQGTLQDEGGNILGKVKTIGRNWSLIFYPESTDENKLVNAIRRLKTPAAISPLHENDVWDEMDVEDWLARHKGDVESLRNAPKVGDYKKPHWHVLLRFKGNKRRHQIDEWVSTFTDSHVNAFVPPDADGDLRYMAHLDDPDKAQYDVADIQFFGGIDPSPLYRQTELQSFGTVASMIELIKDNELDNYADFVDAVFATGEYAPVSSLMKYAIFYDKYLNAYAQKRVSKAHAATLMRHG